jgi:hypothetical protein
MGQQQEARIAKLQNIGRKLVQDGILVNSIQADVQKVTNRWTQLNQQVCSFMSVFMSIYLHENN